jgi:hypothetical protein
MKKLGNKKVVKENIAGFYRLNLNSCFDVTLIDSSAYAIEIETYENIIPLINIKVKHGVLDLENSYSCTWLKNEDLPKIKIYAPTIDTIWVNAPCDVRSHNTLIYKELTFENHAKIFNCDIEIETSYLWFKAVSSTGNYYLRGKCSGWSYLSNSGNGSLYADQLECNEMDFAHLSDGTSKISVYGKLHVKTIKYGYVDLQTLQCPEISFDNPKDKDWFFSKSCL